MCGVCATLVAQLVLGGTSTTSHKCTAGIITRTRIPARTHNTNTVSCLRDMFSRLGKAMMTGQHVKVFCGVGDFVSSDRKTSFEFDRSSPCLPLSLFYPPTLPPSLLLLSRCPCFPPFLSLSPSLARACSISLSLYFSLSSSLACPPSPSLSPSPFLPLDLHYHSHCPSPLL